MKKNLEHHTHEASIDKIQQLEFDILQMLCLRGVTYGDAIKAIERVMHSLQRMGQLELDYLPISDGCKGRMPLDCDYGTSELTGKSLVQLFNILDKV